ncbi:tubulin monoglycylase TTLL3-like [Scylla paramamosain]
MQHNVPYLNPHPNNCVCPHVGYQASFLSPAPAHHAHASSQSAVTPQNPPASAVPAAAKSVKQEEEKEEEATKDEGVKESAEENERCTTTTPDTPPLVSQPCTNSSSLASPPSPPLPPPAPPSCSLPPPQSPTSTPLPASPSPPTSPPSSATSSSSSSSVESEDLKAATTATPGSSSIDEVVPARTIHPPPRDSLVGHSDDGTASVTPDAEESSSTVEGFAASQEAAAQKPVDRINTAILGPSEVRRGLAESITERNATIYKYNTKHVPVKRAPRPRPSNKEDPIPEGTKGDEATQHAEEQGEAEATREEEEEAPAEDEEQQEEQTKERVPTPEPYNPYVDFVVSDVDMPLVARLLRNVEPNLLWTWTRDSISFKHLSREQVVNRFPNTPFTTKYGLCETLQQLHWFSEAAGVDTFVPRGYCIGHEDERTAFIHDYRLTACLNMLKWLTERHDTHGANAVADPHGEVPMKRVRQALGHVEQYIQSCCHDDLDVPPPPSLREHEWVSLLAAHHKIVHNDRKIKVATPNQLQALVRDCESALERVVPFWPQLAMDGVRNLWIVKPGAQSRGRGIFMMNNLEEILALVQSPLIYETKYVVQKYMERPLLIHNTKFDIRQWFLVTDWNPLHVWVYRECYLRFCSQQFDLTNNNEAVHLSNNAIQCKYLNGERSGELPEENMWDVHQFKDYLKGVKKEGKWEEVIYPGMRDALVAAMLAAQVEMDSFKHGFELFGADFMLTEDLRPWLIEINSSPCMAATTSVTRRMCAQCLQDVIKVVVDYRNNRTADTGLFELAYRDSERSIPNPPYLGVNLQVVGRQIKKGPLRPEKRKSKKVRPIERQVKPLSLITLSLEEGPNNTLHAQREPAAREPSGTISRHCSILDCRKYGVGNTTSLPIFSNAESEAEDEECRHARALLSPACDGKHPKPLLPDVPLAECDKKQN